MIIKNKPFHILSSSCVLCAWYFPAAVVGYAARPRGVSAFDYAALLRWGRRASGFSRLVAYQVRLSGYMITNFHDRFCPLAPGVHSLDLFPSEVCPSDFDFIRLLLARRDFMDELAFLRDRTSRRFPMRLVEARRALHRLGGLGGVW